MKAKPSVEFVIKEMKNLGQVEQVWSDDDRKWKMGGPNYVRIVADDGLKSGDVGEDKREIRMDVTAKIAGRFRVGGPLRITC